MGVEKGLMKDLETAIRLRNEGKAKEALELLIPLAEAYPSDAAVHYQCAWSFDVLGQERQAVYYYEKAISLGLDEKDLSDAYLGLGSTYRTLGDYEKSRDVLLRGMALFPQDNALKTFYAMSLYNLGEHADAMGLLLTLLADTASDARIKSYAKAIRFYSGALDQVW